MATIPTAQIIPGPKFTLTPAGVTAANGLFMIGNTDPDNATIGAWSIHFNMSQDWVGSIGILGRNAVYNAGLDDIGLVGPWPFRALYLNGVGWDGSMVSANLAAVGGPSPIITQTSVIVVPAYGATIGLDVQCTAGSCAMYYVPLMGTSIV